MSDEQSYVKWSHDPFNDRYTGSPHTVEVSALPPGAYTLVTDSDCNPYALHLQQKSDRLCELSHGKLPLVIREIRKFWNSADKYSRLGITHKRGIMLYGPPGCGKSEIVRCAIADVVASGGVAMHIANVGEFCDALPKLRQIQPDTPIIAVMEDLENYLRYESTILEMLDGSTTLGANMLYLFTTNKLDEIPERLRCRPSRIDTLIHVDYPTLTSRTEYAEFIAEGVLSSEAIREIAIATSGMSFADIKEVVISVYVFGHTVEETIERLTGSKTEAKKAKRNPGDAQAELDAECKPETVGSVSKWTLDGQ